MAGWYPPALAGALASHKATMMRVQRQQEKQEEAFGNPWSAALPVLEEKTRTQTPRQPSSSPSRKSKGTQTENKQEKEEEEEHKEEERYNFVKKADAMISCMKNTGHRVPAKAPDNQ